MVRSAKSVHWLNGRRHLFYSIACRDIAAVRGVLIIGAFIHWEMYVIRLSRADQQ